LEEQVSADEPISGTRSNETTQMNVDLATARIAAGVMTTALMTAVVIFIATVMLSSDGHGVRIDPPLLLLVTSALGFIYGTLIYANAYPRFKNESKFNAQMHCANAVSEMLGVYPLVLALPLAVLYVVSNNTIQIATIVFASVAFAGYHLSRYSLLERFVQNVVLRTLATIILGGASIWLFVLMRQSHSSSTATVVTCVLVGLLSAATLAIVVAGAPELDPSA
jgi:hypothetical protein